MERDRFLNSLVRTCIGSVVKKNIVPSLAFDGLNEEAFMARVNAIDKGMDGNPALNEPPVPPAIFKGAIAGYTASNAASLDGSKKAIADRKKKRADLTLMLRLLGHYVEGACKGDMTVFLSSGFEPAQRTPSAPQPLAQPTVDKVTQGTTGELLVFIKPVRGARNYELDETVFKDGTPGIWTTTTLAKANKAVPFKGLTPGTTYAFRVRAFGALGHTDWSDIVTRMCI
jgi:hypothetical protein